MANDPQLRDQLIHYFRAVGSGQNMIQCIKEVLFLHQLFSPILIFEKISKGKQRITTKNWRDYLLSINFNFNERQFKYFMKHNGYKSQVILNDFLESIIPYNGDVVRQYKQKCAKSIGILQSNKQVEHIFAQLIENQFKLIRTLINIRDGISATSKLSDIEKLVRDDLLEDLTRNGLLREHRKLKDKFGSKGFKLGFTQLRKVFKVWVSERTILHQLCMLNVMRHLKSNDPFCRIIFQRKRKNLINDKSQGRRSVSHSFSANDDTPYGSKEKRMPQAEQSPYSKHQINYGPDNKYNDYKDKLLDEFQQKKKQQIYRENAKASNKKASLQNQEQIDAREYSYHKETKEPSYQKEGSQHMFKENSGGKSFSRRPQTSKEPKQSGSNYHQYGGDSSLRTQQRKNNGAQIIFKFFEQITTKEEKLEKLKKDLAKNNDFSLINLYKLMDHKNKGYVTARDIADFPEIQKAQYSYLINFYGRQKDRLLFHEFCQIFRPISRQLNELIDSRPENKIPDPFKRETRQLIIEILRMTAEEHFNLHKMREAMQQISPKQTFSLMDVLNKGYLDSETLLAAFKHNNIYCDEKILKCLMRMFKKRINEKISSADFAKFIEI